jgi:hypothetical protein
MTYVKYTPVRNIHNHDKLSVKCAFFGSAKLAKINLNSVKVYYSSCIQLLAHKGLVCRGKWVFNLNLSV